MELSLFLAQVIGIVFFILGCGVICNAGYYKKAYSAMLKNEGTILLSTILALTIGSFLVLTHNVWDPNWTVLITIFGWLALLKGFLLAIFPQQMIALSVKILKNTWVYYTAGTFYTIIGVVLLYFGFFV